MATQNEIEVGKLFRHKGGKLYRIEGNYMDRDRPRWGVQVDASGKCLFDADGKTIPDQTKISATQWQVNEKFPQGRPYQASRELKIADLTAI